MVRRTTRFRAATLLLITTLPAVASAEPSPADRADELFQEGKKLIASGDIAGGRSKYADAYALKPSADIACNLGSAEVSLKVFDRGAEHLEECLRIFPATGTPEQKAAATKRLAEAKAEVTEVRVTANKEGAKLVVDGEERGLLPRPGALYLLPGEHRVDATYDGFESQPSTITVTKGASQSISLTLSPRNAIAPGGKRTPIPAVIGFVLGGGALAAAIGTLVAANGADFSTCASLAVCEEVQGDQNTMSNVSVSMFVTSGALLGASAGLLVWSLTGEKKDAAVVVAPIVAPGSAYGLSVGGQF